MGEGIGIALRNGARVLRFNESAGLVLAEWPGRWTPFVTWRVDADGNAYWGNYHRELRDAETDFAKRERGLAWMIDESTSGGSLETVPKHTDSCAS